jgi:16S rRNA (guanine1516-N2)-methyltransferase
MSRYHLQKTDSGLRLVDKFSHQHPLLINFSDAEFSYRLRRGGGKKEMLARAVDAKPGLRVVDCTAGLGRDSFLLASLGCEMTLYERSPVLALLLRDAIDRALQNEALFEIANRLHLVHGDALQAFDSGIDKPDVILVDPMFPARKKSAKVKGEMQFLQRFIGKDEDATRLLQSALATGCERLVLKRPLLTNDIAGMKPSFSLKGKSSRFDVFLQ